MAATDMIETVRFGARGPDAPDNFDEWATHSQNHVLGRASERFQCEASFWQLDRVVVTEQWLGPFTGQRSAERLAAAPTNQVTFVVILDGAMTYRRDGDDIGEASGAGDVVLLDFRRSYAFDVTANHTVNISMDRGMLEDEVGPLWSQGRMPRTAETGILVDFASALVRRLPGMAAASAVPVAAVLRRLVITALRRDDMAVEPALRAQRAAALVYIESQPTGRLDVAEMGDALGMTRATLYRLFRGDGGVLAYDRRRRLRLLHRSLIEEGAGTTLSELGMRYGFFDLSNLARQFRAQFGLSMSEVRMHLLPRLNDGDSIGRYREAIARFE